MQADLGKTIKVRVSFTDEGGTEETLTSDATTAVAADATGPVPTGAQVLTIGHQIYIIFDETFLHNLDRWPPKSAFTVEADGAEVVVGGVFVNNVDISGSVLGQVLLSGLSPVIYQGQTVTVTYTEPSSGDDTNAIQDEAGNDAASFTTGEGDVPAVTNDSTVATVAPGAPTGLTATANGATQIDLTWTAPADNGGRVIEGYQIEYSDDAGMSWSVLVADTQSTDTMYSDTTLSGGETRHYRVSAINSIGTGEASNSPPTGKPVITGTPEVKHTLTADVSDIMDADGLPDADQFSYQWIRNDNDISGATDSTYTLVQADLGKTIKVKVTFTDEAGTEETLTSDATTAVAADATGPVPTGAQVLTIGHQIYIIFDETFLHNLDRWPPKSAFTVEADGAEVVVGGVFVNNVDISGSVLGQVLLSGLSPVIYQGQTVTVTYTDPSSGDDTNAIQDEAGNDAASFTTGEGDVPAVTNNSTVARPVGVTGPLVSNIGQTAASSTANVTTNQSQGQGFTTGANSGGYILGSVELAVTSFSGTASDITVSIYSESSGNPGTLVHTLTTPASISEAVTTFTAPSGATLAASTTYYVVITSTSSRISLGKTAAPAEDTGGASGWSIADDRRFGQAGGWGTGSSPIRMRINGPAAAVSNDATVVPLGLEPGTRRPPGRRPVPAAVHLLDAPQRLALKHRRL